MLNNEGTNMISDDPYFGNEQDFYKNELEEEQSLVTHRKHAEKMRPCAWVRKHEHKKRMRQKYMIMHHQGDSQGEKGMQLRDAIYCVWGITDWRTHGYVYYHQHLYLSSRGDIRVYHGSITAYPHIYTPVPTYSRKYHAVQANRRIRHMKDMEESAVSYSWLKKRYTCFDDGL